MISQSGTLAATVRGLSPQAEIIVIYEQIVIVGSKDRLIYRQTAIN